jgi:hypothetical protein
MNEKKCTGDCIKCSLQQQIYCSSQHCHAIHETLCHIVEMLNNITSVPGGIINPLETPQKDSGVENRESKV